MPLNATFASDNEITASFGTAAGPSEYSGPYEVTPSEETQTLETSGMSMSRNVSIDPIPSKYIIPLGTKSITANGNGIDVAQYSAVDVNVPSAQPIGTIAQRPDAVLVKTWKADRRVVADDRVPLPAYSTNAQTLIASANLEAASTDPNDGYCYFLAYRGAIYPIYNTDVQVQGRQEYTIVVYSAEQIYNPANTFHAINGSGAYVATAPAATGAVNAAHYRHIYWNSTTNMSVYNAGIYGATITFPTPTFSTESIVPSSPVIGIRGQNTYMKQSVYETITDIRYQYIIELWRVPRPNIGLNGFFYNNIDALVATDLAGNTHTIT